MRIEQFRWTEREKWVPAPPGNLKGQVQLALVFGSTAICRNTDLMSEIRSLYPEAQIFGCSTAGEICGCRVTDDSLVLTVVQFEETRIRGVKAVILDAENSFS
ncbi:MAG TPA: FIST N-terminal domain-containing protein, partial [Syntrophales bacterium]|nr:FIST N-terminal domain-containing protein [Syntrophales bacterium]